ncbi:BLUF domain-containing protein [Candidatus Albibeggiatoa sp. nov. NOAA]|uniref:BLUF domain-containing protein n=1 Tax=Candidatus Albibeggiatoa sp. nov. NOAA TaxID=3162724 RepID=UPI0032FE6D70|nr:BLUF domain-containing protein [Thiotrichaceae bacterium]
MDIYLSRLFYASTATEKCTPQEVDKIVFEGRQHNAALDVTGTLCFENNYFLGCLEGSRKNINIIFNKIASDDRHFEVHLLELKEVSHRYFEQYLTMFNSKDIVQHLIDQNRIHEFNPYLLSSSHLNEVFRDVTETLEIATKPPPLTKPKKGLLNLFNTSR